MNILKALTNGCIIVIIGFMHMLFALSKDAFGTQFKQFAQSGFFKIHEGLNVMPFKPETANIEAFAAFWFFYFGLFLIPLGVLLHIVEKKKGSLPVAFTISYLICVLTGCYMVPSSGMTYIMLPHALYMVIIGNLRSKRFG
jgi:hypothetical protein